MCDSRLFDGRGGDRLPSEAEFAQLTVDLHEIDHCHTAAGVAPNQMQPIRTEVNANRRPSGLNASAALSV